MSRKEGGRGLASIEDSVNTSIQRLEDQRNTAIQKTITRKQKREEKLFHGYFMRQTSDNSYKKTWTWLRKRNILRETESFLIAAQNNTIKTNYIKAKIDKTTKL